MAKTLIVRIALLPENPKAYSSLNYSDSPDALPKVVLAGNMLKLDHRQFIQQTCRTAKLMSPHKALEARTLCP